EPFEERLEAGEVALDLLAAARGTEHLEARRQERGDGLLHALDARITREHHVDLIDEPLAPEHVLRAGDVHERQVAAERAPDPACRRETAQRERLDAGA